MLRAVLNETVNTYKNREKHKHGHNPYEVFVFVFKRTNVVTNKESSQKTERHRDAKVDNGVLNLW